MYQAKKLFLLISIPILLSCNENSRTSEKEIAVHSHDLQFLREEIKKFPDSLALSQELIEAYRNNGEYDSAVAITKTLISKDTGNAYLWNVMATLTYEMGDTTQAIQALEKAVSIFPLPDYFVALGTVYAETRNKNALEIAETLLDQPDPNPNKADAYFIKGLYYNYSNNPKEAIPELDSALKLNYTFMYAYREKAIALYDLRKYPEALSTLRKAVTLQNGYDEGYYWMGKVYEKLNLKDSAILSYQIALLYDKNFEEAKTAIQRLKESK